MIRQVNTHLTPERFFSSSSKIPAEWCSTSPKGTTVGHDKNDVHTCAKCTVQTPRYVYFRYSELDF